MDSIHCGNFILSHDFIQFVLSELKNMSKSKSDITLSQSVTYKAMFFISRRANCN